MCLIALAIGCHARYPLVVAANRDEWFDRPAAALDWWPADDGPPILGGRDLRAGGGWLALTPAGRLAMLTNIRRPGVVRDDAPSRGSIVAGWLRSEFDAQRYARQVLAGAEHNPFNLLAFDFARGEAAWIDSDRLQPQRLADGVWGLSNAALDTPWPKTQRLKQALGRALDAATTADGLVATMLAALADRHQPADDELPHTGVPLEWERWLASACIRTPDGRYGTRCSTVLVWERQACGDVLHVVERSHDDDLPADRRVRLDGWPSRPGA